MSSHAARRLSRLSFKTRRPRFMRVKFHSNKNFHLGAVEELRSPGYGVLTSVEAGRANQRVPDEQFLEFARQESRAVLTFNRLHFVCLHKQSPARWKLRTARADSGGSEELLKFLEERGLTDIVVARLTSYVRRKEVDLPPVDPD
jgi:hypothetical protein